jgi:hypothetical protein
MQILQTFSSIEAPEMPTKRTRLRYLVQQLALVRLQDTNTMFKVTAVGIGGQPGVCFMDCGRVCVKYCEMESSSKTENTKMESSCFIS